MSIAQTYVSEGNGYIRCLRTQVDRPINRRKIDLQLLASRKKQRSTSEPIFSHAENENKRVEQRM